MSERSKLSSQERRPGAVTAGAVLTWVSGGFVALFGAMLLIAARTGAGNLASALAQSAGVSSTASADGYPGLGVVLLVVGVLPAVLAVAAFRRSWAALIGLTVTACVYAVAVLFLMLEPGYTVPGQLHGSIGLLWVGLAIVLFWRSKDWYSQQRADSAGPEATGDLDPRGTTAVSSRRPGRVVAGTVMVWLTGAGLLAAGARLAWSGFSALRDPDNTAMFPALTTALGLMIGAVGVVFLVLASTTFAGSLETLVALTVVGLVALGVFLVGTASAQDASTTIGLDLLGIGWLTVAAVLLWSRASRDWYRSRGR